MPETASALPTDEERALLRDSVRGFLAEHWPADRAVAGGADAQRVRAIWRALAGQGLATLGTDPCEGALREALVVAQELGRAACPAPFADAILFNLAALGEKRARSALTLALHAGEACVCVSFGGFDPDPSVGAPRCESASLSGVLQVVDAAHAATHFAVLVEPGPMMAIVAVADGGVRVEPTRAMGADGAYRVAFTEAPAALVPLAIPVAELLDVARLLLAARAHGAAERAFELVVDYVKQRKQFGQPIGRFQAIQHKLANSLITLMGVRLALDNAAAHFDRGAPEWRSFAASVSAFAGARLRAVSMETHHAFGAIGYAEEHEAPRHFKRVHLDTLRHGGARAARGQLADYFLGDTPRQFPQFDLGAEGNAFRLEVRAWLAEHWPAHRREAYEASDPTHRDYDPAFSRELGETGWLGLTWPRRFGGMERSPYEMLAFMEEMHRAGAPRAGAPIQAQSWQIFGRPEQQAHYLPELLRGEKMYGMWYSEPDSGSDLASIRTSAVRDGDHWVINGQKIWTTTYWADYMWLAVRTDPEARPRHAGISMFVVRSDTPGITRRPMRTMYDGEFCNTFFDNVRIPAADIVGAENGGWAVLTGSLGTERAYVGSRIILEVAGEFEKLCRLLGEIDGGALRRDPVVRDTLADFAAQIEIGRQLALNAVRLLAQGIEPTWEAAVAKVWAGELMERFFQSVVDILGMRATLSRGAPGALDAGHLEQRLRHSLMWVISIGTNEIQRNLIAQRGLGLPR